MRELMPDGEDFGRAMRWVSAQLQENPDLPVQSLVQKAIYNFDLSPKVAEDLIMFFNERKDRE